MTIKKALAELEKEYERALQLEFVHNPLAWALYRVWRMASEDPKKKGGTTVAKDKATAQPGGGGGYSKNPERKTRAAALRVREDALHRETQKQAYAGLP